MQDKGESHRVLGYEFALEKDARRSAEELQRRFTERELTGLRIFRIRWNGNYLVDATFSGDTPDPRLDDARAILAEAGTQVHPDDLSDYKRATESGEGLPEWLKRFFGERY